ncbi:MAG: hypothetical protein FWD47_01600 [Treponema sp.]|nr:hypothetical protein [Treponema sp.]
MYCSKCGKEFQNDAAFCSSCGNKAEPQQNSIVQESNDNNLVFKPSPEIADSESRAVASLVMGIISLVTSWLIVGIILGAIAISTGKKARTVLNESHDKFHIALAGVITGSIGLALSIFMTVFWIFYIGILIAVLSTALHNFF